MSLPGRARLVWVLPYGLFLIVAVLAIVYRDDPVAQRWLDGVGYGVIELLGIGYSLRVATHPSLDQRSRRPWRYITVAWVILLLSAFGFTASIGTDSVEVSAALLFALALRLLFLVFLLRGLLLFDVRRYSRRANWKLVLDVITVVGSVLMVTWYVLVGPTLANAGSIPLIWAVSAGYTVGDLLLVFGVCAVLLRGTVTAARMPLTLLLTGCGAYLAVDIYVTYLAVHNRALGMPGTGGLTLALLTPTFLMVLAAVEQNRLADQGRFRTARPLIGRPTWLPYAALVLGFSLLVVAAAHSVAYPWWGLIVGAVVTTTAVAARQVIALRENHTLIITDSLTGLASRVRLLQALRQANNHSGQLVAVLHIDLDEFKRVNDVYGHDTGDAYLTAFADVLRRHIRATDTAARLGGDEFAVVLDGVRGTEQAVAVAERILAEAGTPTDVDGRQLRIRASVGIAVADSSTVDAHQILRWADQAMYVAKRRGNHGWRLYAEGAMEDDVDAMRLLLDRARSAGQLRLAYQPIVSLATGDLVAVEALVRWQHPTRGLVMPLEFIPLAEESGAIYDIGLWVVDEASRQVARWRQRLPATRGLQLTVNVSPRQLASDTLAGDIGEIVRRHGLPPGDVVAEVTEAGVVDEGTAVDQLEALRRQGVRIALDDFGTGYSSLRYLTRLPVDILKLDRSFVSELNGTVEGSAVAEAVIRLAQILHLDTVAEGIETDGQATELTLFGYHNAQGFRYARPLSGAEVDELIAAAGGGWPRLGPAIDSPPRNPTPIRAS